jgi:hypothetical protein
MTLGRVPQSGLVLKDSEVSGKHAQINWNANVSCSHHFLFFSPSACYCIQTIDHFENWHICGGNWRSVSLLLLELLVL